MSSQIHACTDDLRGPGAAPLARDRLAYFDALYAQRDPYGTRTRWYERRKRGLALASLPHERYARAFEPACGSGELTQALAQRCDSLLSSDFCEGALRQARQRVEACHNVVFSALRVPAQWPVGEARFDLIVLSELCSFLGAQEVAQLSRRSRDSLASGGVIVACDWRWPFDARVLDASWAHRILGEVGLAQLVRHDEEDFVLSVWSTDARSVARREGIATGD